MEKEIEKLKAACFRLARNTMWEMRPVDTDLIEAHANNLFKIAKGKAELSEELSVTIPMLVRAVDYLRQTHALPPMKEDTIWFENMLDALLEVACPNAKLEGEGRNFLKDLQAGITNSLYD